MTSPATGAGGGPSQQQGGGAYAAVAGGGQALGGGAGVEEDQLLRSKWLQLQQTGLQLGQPDFQKRDFERIWRRCHTGRRAGGGFAGAGNDAKSERGENSVAGVIMTGLRGWLVKFVQFRAPWIVRTQRATGNP